jgi:hypothetical protein
MALFQSDNARGFIQSPRPTSAGVEMVARWRFVFTTALAFATDRLEIGIIPPFCRITNMVLIGDVGAANNLSVGLMSGTPGVNDNARTVGTEFFTTVSGLATLTRMVNLGGFRVPVTDVSQAVGITFSANVAASPSNTVEILAYYAADR